MLMTRNGPLRRFPIPILLMIVLGCELGVATAATRSGLTVVATAQSATSIERPVASSAMAKTSSERSLTCSATALSWRVLATQPAANAVWMKRCFISAATAS